MYLQKYVSDNYNVKKNKIIASDEVIIVLPEYNGSFPASLKLFIDEFFNCIESSQK